MSDIISYDFEINDYPVNARSKVTNRNFINQMNDLNNCIVSLRGEFYEANKKVPPGKRKLYLHIEGDS